MRPRNAEKDEDYHDHYYEHRRIHPRYRPSEKEKTYKLTADVSASGTEVELGVNDYNGRYTNLNQKTNKNGQLSFTFTTASHIDTVEVYLQVLRYQTNNTPVTVSNIQLVQED